jgi:hypothetical protein
MPTSGALLCPVAWTALHKNSALSRPGLPADREERGEHQRHATERQCGVEAPVQLRFEVAAVRRIQKIIQVTKATATIYTSPAKASC